jgi:hypothetical protein
MSKKSRQRNKKILAAIGIGLGAAAMASKRKSELLMFTKTVVEKWTKTNSDTAKKDQVNY